MFSRFDRIPACNRQTDGRTAGQTSYHGIVRAMHTRRAVKTSRNLGRLHNVDASLVTSSALAAARDSESGLIHASGPVHLFLSVCLSVAKMQKRDFLKTKQFRAMMSIGDP